MSDVVDTVVHLRSASTSLLLDLATPTPRLVHWGAALGIDVPDLATLTGPVSHSAYDTPRYTELVPQASSGYSGQPALVGSRAGRDFSPSLRLASAEIVDTSSATIVLADTSAGLSLAVELHLSASGMLRARSAVTNTGESDYSVHALHTILPTGPEASELLDLTGRWCRERHPQRQQILEGTWLRSGRHGRTGHDSSLLFAAGSAGFSNRRGSVWGVHLGFSGDQQLFLESAQEGTPRIGAGELLGQGEVVLGQGEKYSTPWLYAAFSDAGIDGVTRVFHEWVRARSGHPVRPRPVTLNTWEAVYFNHDITALTDLARRAGELGVERFVLDDGWFPKRRDDSAGLGDWFVDDLVWPDGLTPLIETVREQGMEFGLWVEPEMIQDDSDVARAHPDWVSRAAADRVPRPWRRQHVLDLVNQNAWDYVYSRLDALLAENDIAYLKWDQNRDLVDMGHDALPSTHEQTLAVYRMLDALRAAHPGVEIESCSSGGGRIDLGILERTDRVWASDTNDALERQTIQRWTASVVPPELIGAHIGPARAHTTGRVHSLSFRAITALFGHFGIEWDIRSLTDEIATELAMTIELHKRYRGLLHHGVTVNADLADPAYRLHGVVSQNSDQALFAFVSLQTSSAELPGNIAFPGLDADRNYAVSVVYPDLSAATKEAAPSGWAASGIVVSGRFLGTAGVPMPNLLPEHAVLIELAAVS